MDTVIAIVVVLTAFMGFAMGVFLGYLYRTRNIDYRWRYVTIYMTFSATTGISLILFDPAVSFISALSIILAPWLSSVTGILIGNEDLS